MIKLTYGQLNNNPMQSSLAKLAQIPMPIKFSWNVQRIIRQIQGEIKEGVELYKKLLKDNCVLDEKGDLLLERTPPIVKEDGSTIEGKVVPGSFTPKNAEDFELKNKEFMELEIEIQSYPILLKDLEGQMLSAEDLLNLSPLISDAELSLVS